MVIITGDNKVIIDVFLLSIITCFIDNTVNLLIISGKRTVLKPLVFMLRTPF